MPEWFGPPAGVVGGVEPLELIAARSEDAVVWLESATAYPAGVELRMEVRWRAQVQNLVMRAAAWPHERLAGGELPAEVFRAGCGRCRHPGGWNSSASGRPSGSS